MLGKQAGCHVDSVSKTESHRHALVVCVCVCEALGAQCSRVAVITFCSSRGGGSLNTNTPTNKSHITASTLSSPIDTS